MPYDSRGTPVIGLVHRQASGREILLLTKYDVIDVEVYFR